MLRRLLLRFLISACLGSLLAIQPCARCEQVVKFLLVDRREARVLVCVLRAFDAGLFEFQSFGQRVLDFVRHVVFLRSLMLRFSLWRFL